MMMRRKVDLTRIDGTSLTYLLPSPDAAGRRPFEEILSHRRSQRLFSGDAISAEEISQILWAAYGISSPASGNPVTGNGLRTAPSAGALYPLELYLLTGNVKGIDPGVYRYIPAGHKLVRVIIRDIRKELSLAALDQEMIAVAPACLFYSAVYSRSTRRYGVRGSERYICMDLGHSAQNVYLQAEALQLGTCAIGAFNDTGVKRIMQLPEDEKPLYIMPVGRYYI